jgi:hypothetical protein
MYLAKRASDEAPHYAVFSNVLSHHLFSVQLYRNARARFDICKDFLIYEFDHSEYSCPPLLRWNQKLSKESTIQHLNFIRAAAFEVKKEEIEKKKKDFS